MSVCCVYFFVCVFCILEMWKRQCCLVTGWGRGQSTIKLTVKRVGGKGRNKGYFPKVSKSQYPSAQCTQCAMDLLVGK